MSVSRAPMPRRWSVVTVALGLLALVQFRFQRQFVKKGNYFGHLQLFTTTASRPTTLESESSALVAAQAQIDFWVQELTHTPLRYYMYDDPAIAQPDATAKLLQEGKAPYQTEEVFFEIQVLEILRLHPLDESGPLTASASATINHTQPPSLRVADPAVADIYILPSGTGTLIYGGPSWKGPSSAWEQSLKALLDHPLFQSTMGHRHVLFSMPHPFYTCETYGRLKWLGLHKAFPALWNVTIATDLDWANNWYIRHHGLAAGHDFASAFRPPVSRYSFSLGLYALQRLPLVEASYEKFSTAVYEIFYRSRVTESMNNSTVYRHAPFRPDVLAALSNNNNHSIGHDLPKDEWLDHFQNSKFCLAIRGDSPHSHALLRSVKVGCLPVIVSDFWPLYAPTLGRFVNVTDFSVLIPEAEFMADPATALRRLRDLDESVVREKLLWLAFAQRLFFAEHPQSLFVPALVSQAWHASKVDLLGPNFVNLCNQS